MVSLATVFGVNQQKNQTLARWATTSALLMHIAYMMDIILIEPKVMRNSDMLGPGFPNF